MQYSLVHQLWLTQQGVQIFRETNAQSVWCATVMGEDVPWCWIDASTCVHTEDLLRAIFQALRSNIVQVDAAQVQSALSKGHVWFVFADRQRETPCSSYMLVESSIRVIELPSLQKLSQSVPLRQHVWHYLLKLL